MSQPVNSQANIERSARRQAGLDWFFLSQPGRPSLLNVVLVVCIVAGLLVFGWPGWNWRAVVIGVSALLLAAQRWLIYWRYGPNTPPLAAGLTCWVIQLLLIEAIIWVAGSPSMLFIYLLPALRGFYYLGEKIGLWLSGAVWLLFAGQMLLYPLPVELYLLYVLIFSLALLFLGARNQARQRETVHRRHTEQLLRELEVSHRQLQDYAAQVEELAATQERNRIAREIHDSLGHYLTAINIQAETALVLQKHAPDEAGEALVAIRRLAKEAIQDVRRSVATLREETSVFSLPAALTELVERVRQAGQFSISLEITGEQAGFANQSLVTLQRVAQEGLTNIQKYAEAGQVTLSLIFAETEARLCLRDDGRGFDPAGLAKRPAGRLGGYGLLGLRERLELIGGSFELESVPGQGTRLVAVAPKNPYRPASLATAATGQENS